MSQSPPSDGELDTAIAASTLTARDDEEVYWDAIAKKAAKMKMYGRLTRERVEWYPDKILSTRFNVKHPYGDYSVVGVAQASNKRMKDLEREIRRLREGMAERDLKIKMDNEAKTSALVSVKLLEREIGCLREERRCKICMEADAAVLFDPCGHLSTCSGCSSSLTECPMCRNRIKRKIRAFMS